MFASLLHLFLSIMSRRITIPMLGVFFVLLYTTLAISFWAAYIFLRRQFTDICSTFITFCIAIEAVGSLHQVGTWALERKRSCCYHGKEYTAVDSDEKLQ
jgi:hypothetical protein